MKTKKYIFILLTILIFSLYGNTFNNKFVYDDNMLIVKNEFIKNLSNVKFLLSNEYFEKASELSYRPLQTLTYFIDFKLWGLDKVYGWHLFNISLHIINSFLVLILVGQLFKNQWLSIISSFIFAVHPACTEAITGITYREDPLAALFFFISFIFYIKWRKAKSNYRVERFFSLISAISFLMSLLSKESTMILPLIILLWELKLNSDKQSILCTIWHWLVLIFYMILRFKVFVSLEEIGVERLGGNIINSLLMVPYLTLKYIYLTFFPIELCPDYVVKMLPLWHSIIYSIVFFVALITITISINKFKIISLCFLFFLICLLPVINIIPIANPFAIRYIYLPMGFGCVLIAFLCLKGIDLFFKNNKNEQSRMKILTTVFFTGLIIILFSIKTVSINKVWANDYSLWNYTLKCEPCSSRAYNNLGSNYIKQGKIEKAIEMFKKAAELNPSNWRIYNNLGIAYAKLGDGENEMRSFKLAIVKSVCYNPYFNLGVSYEAKGKRRKAEIYYKKAMEIEPNCGDCYMNLAYLYNDMGNLREANLMYRKAVNLKKK